MLKKLIIDGITLGLFVLNIPVLSMIAGLVMVWLITNFLIKVTEK